MVKIVVVHLVINFFFKPNGKECFYQYMVIQVAFKMQVLINVFPSDLDLLKLMSLNMERLNYILCHKSSCHIVKFGKWEHRPSSHYRSI